MSVLGPLPSGRHRYSREQVAHHQRERLIAAVVDAVAEKGYAAVTLADIVSRAKVSRRVFYANFADKEECFLAAFDVIVEHLRELVAAAIADVDDWPEQVRAATDAILSYFAAEPALAKFVCVESIGAGPAGAARLNRVVGELAPLLALGRKGRPEGEAALPASTEDATLATLTALVRREVSAGRAAALPDSVPLCAELALMPYLGSQAAAQAARRP